MAEIQDYSNPRRHSGNPSYTLQNLAVRDAKERAVLTYTSADDSDVVIVIKYKGTEQSCLITTAGNNSILSEVGDTDSEAADTNFGVAGTMDLTAAAYDTLGEIVDSINGIKDSDDMYTYEAWLVGGIRADDADVAGALVAAADAQAKLDDGLEIKRDSDVALNATMVVSSRVAGEPFEPRTAVNQLYRFTGTFTYTGADYLQIYEVDDLTNTETLIYQQDLGTSTAETDITNWINTGLGGIQPSADGMRLLIRATAATTFATTAMQIVGSSKRFD